MEVGVIGSTTEDSDNETGLVVSKPKKLYNCTECVFSTRWPSSLYTQEISPQRFTSMRFVSFKVPSRVPAERPPEN